METVSAEANEPRLGPGDDAARKRAAVETYAQNETTLLRTARRFSLCTEDAEEALQRGLEILLRKAPTSDPRELIKWTQTVVKREALAVRREREEILAGPAVADAFGTEDWVALLPSGSAGPEERTERREEIARSREALQALKPQELRALTLLAEGYSYAEIGEITNWSRTKINRSLAEGRERFRMLIARSEDGSRCAELRPLLSAFCDGEASAEEVTVLREHLRACASCRATLRAYRAAPATAAALAPTLPLHRSLWERAQDAFEGVAARFGGGADGVSQVAGGGASGAGVAAAAKVAAVCVGAAGGAAACIGAGLVPAPLDLGGEQDRPRLERQIVGTPDPAAPPPVTYEPAPVAPKDEPRPKRNRKPDRQQAPAQSEPVPAETAPVSGSAVEYTPPPEPVTEPAPVAASSGGGGSPAGEFGP
ncbi:MAG TPA: sigma-70 family RNA polymerase sigma factor [Solirubrobacterales bacterium]